MVTVTVLLVLIFVTSIVMYAKLDVIQTRQRNQGRDIRTLMAGVTDINNAQTTLHTDLETENGLIQQLLTAFASGALTPAQAQAIVDGMNQDDATAKSNIALITAALPAA